MIANSPPVVTLELGEQPGCAEPPEPNFLPSNSGSKICYPQLSSRVRGPSELSLDVLETAKKKRAAPLAFLLNKQKVCACTEAWEGVQKAMTLSVWGNDFGGSMKHPVCCFFPEGP